MSAKRNWVGKGINREERRAVTAGSPPAPPWIPRSVCTPTVNLPLGNFRPAYRTLRAGGFSAPNTRTPRQNVSKHFAIREDRPERRAWVTGDAKARDSYARSTLSNPRPKSCNRFYQVYLTRLVS